MKTPPSHTHTHTHAHTHTHTTAHTHCCSALSPATGLFELMDLESTLQSLSLFLSDTLEPTVLLFHPCKGNRKCRFSLIPKMGSPSQRTQNPITRKFFKMLVQINKCLISLIWFDPCWRHHQSDS